MATTRHLVIGYAWRDGAAVLRLLQLGGETWELDLEGHLSFEVTQERRCVGHFGHGGPECCPDGAEPLSTQCGACIRRDLFRPCMICNGFRCPTLAPTQHRRCTATHHLYLACFGAEDLKVGTAANLRRDARLIEQGPLAGARVAQGPGPQIKQMEHVLSHAGFTEAMRRSRKLALMLGGMTVAEAAARIREAANALPDILPDAYHQWLHAPHFVELPEVALRSRGMSATQMPIQPGRMLDGEVVGAVGHVLYLSQHDATVAVDLGALKARVIDLEPVGPRKRPEVQLGLF